MTADVLLGMLGQVANIESKVPTATDQLALRSDQVTDGDLPADKIAKLDNLDEAVSLARVKPPAIAVTPGEYYTATAPKLPPGLPSFNAGEFGVGSFGWKNYLSVSGSGYIHLAAAYVRSMAVSTHEQDGRMQMQIDGVTIATTAARTFAQNWGVWTSFVGFWDFENEGCSMVSIPFNSSFLFRWYRGASGTSYNVDARLVIQYTRTS